jgi:hypothetical protein
MPSPYQIALSGGEEAVLTARARSVRGEYRDRLRAAIVLAAAAGTANAAIAAELGCAPTRSASGAAGSRPGGWPG